MDWQPAVLLLLAKAGIQADCYRLLRADSPGQCENAEQTTLTDYTSWI